MLTSREQEIKNAEEEELEEAIARASMFENTCKILGQALLIACNGDNVKANEYINKVNIDLNYALPEISE